MRPHAFTKPTDRDIINDVIVNDNRTWTIMNSIYSLNDRITTAEMSLTGKAPVVHSHIIGDTAGLQGALDGKASTVHSHPIADVTGLQAALDAKVNISGLSGYVTGASLATILGDYATNTALTSGLAGKADVSITADLTTRVGALESGPDSWTVWKANKPAKIAQVTETPSGGTVNILGIEVATGSSITSMQTAFNALKASHNSVLTLLSNREVQGA